jgi:hypothetical protein
MDFAVIENDVVINVVVGESREIVQSVITDKLILEINPDAPIRIGYYLENGQWVNPNPPIEEEGILEPASEEPMVE